MFTKNLAFFIECIGKGDVLSSMSVTFSSKLETSFKYCSSQLERQVKLWLEAYFNQTPIHLEIPCELQGTPFQKKVWDVLKKIPFGTTKSYAEVAKDVGIPKGSRAVGNACGKNQFFLLIPCHRVRRSDQTIGGFAVDLEIKRRLLTLEGIY